MGQGSTFSVYLPASDEKPSQQEPQREKLITGNHTVLLVDDEDVIIEVGSQMLEALGYHVLTARSGPEAIQTYQDNLDRIDLVVLDMIMPGMGGREVYMVLNDLNRDVRVLLSSGYDINVHVRDVLDHGCQGFIQKPFNLKQFSAKIHQIISEQLNQNG